MGTTSITLTLIVVAIAIGATIWMVISRRSKSRERHHVPKEGQEPRQPEPTTADESLMQSEESHPLVAEDEATTPADKTSTVAATEPIPPLEGDVGLAIKEDFTDQVQKGIPEASVESPDSSTEAKPLDPETHSNSESQQSALEQKLEEPADQPVAEGEVTGASVEGAEEIGESTETAEKAVRKPRKNAPSLTPAKRGGRSRVPTPSTDIEREQKPKPRAAKPEIVCWKREREWILAVELPEDFSENQIVTVEQDGKPLDKDDTKDGCWRISQLHGEVVVRVLDAENESLFKLPLDDAGCLIFKLSGGDRNRGRHVKRPGSGSCLVVVPKDWKRDEALAGTPPYEPEDVCLLGYRAHFFEL